MRDETKEVKDKIKLDKMIETKANHENNYRFNETTRLHQVSVDTSNNFRFKSTFTNTNNGNSECATWATCDTCMTSLKILKSMDYKRWDGFACKDYTYRKECISTCDKTKESMVRDYQASTTYSYNNPCNYCFRMGYCDIATCQS